MNFGREPSIPNPSANFGSILRKGCLLMQGKNKRIIALVFIALLLTLQAISFASAAENFVTLRFGSRGSEVTRLQNALKNKGYYNSRVDGIYGRITERAVINFQKDSRILVDGIAGRQTQTKLYGTTTAVNRSSTRSVANSGDVYWLSRIIHAEASGEPYRGKVAVGNVVLNRVKSKDFPNSVYNVIFEYYKNIPQFSPVADGTIYNTPSSESVRAAREAISGSRPVGNATYFFNPDKAAGSWIVRTKTYITRIGGHVFYQ